MSLELGGSIWTQGPLKNAVLVALVAGGLVACGGSTAGTDLDSGVTGGSGGVATGGGDAGGSTASGGQGTTGGNGGAGAGGSGGSDGSCLVGDVLYPNGDPLPSSDCEACSCLQGTVVCTQTACTPAIDCISDFDAGLCDAAFQVFWFNAATGSCEERIWGGCGGNQNRFSDLVTCQTTCAGQPSTGGPSCEVKGVIYPDGTWGFKDPTGCNTCSCEAGQLACTAIDCVDLNCPEGTIWESDCTRCGPTDACEVVRSDCLPTCQTQDDCTSGGLCLNGVCKQVCG